MMAPTVLADLGVSAWVHAREAVDRRWPRDGIAAAIASDRDTLVSRTIVIGVVAIVSALYAIDERQARRRDYPTYRHAGADDGT